MRRVSDARDEKQRSMTGVLSWRRRCRRARFRVGQTRVASDITRTQTDQEPCNDRATSNLRQLDMRVTQPPTPHGRLRDQVWRGHRRIATVTRVQMAVPARFE